MKNPDVFGNGNMYTVTKGTSNEALLWKIAVLGMGKDPCWAWNIFSLSYTDILHSSMQERSSSLRRRIFAVLGGEKYIPEAGTFFPAPAELFYTHIGWKNFLS